MVVDVARARILGLSNMIETARVDDKDGIRVEAEAIAPIFPEHRCEDGQAPHIVRDGWRRNGRREFADTPHANRPVRILYRQAMARCKACGKRSMSEIIEHMQPDFRMTRRLYGSIAGEAVRETHTAIAKRFGVEERTVLEVFRQSSGRALSVLTSFPPRVLGLDFKKLSRKRTVAVICNLESRTVVDVVDGGSRALRGFLDGFAALPTVEKVVTDLNPGWLKLHREVLPHTKHIADKWHVMRRANFTVDTIVRKAANRFPSEKRKYARLLGLLRYRPESATMKGGGLAELEALSGDKRHLVDAYWAKERFYQMFDLCADSGQARDYYEKWRDWLPETVREAFEAHCVVDEEWEQAIFNHFDHPYTNAVVESVNGRIKELNRTGRSYKFDVLRAKLILTPSTQAWVAGYPFDSYVDAEGNPAEPWWNLQWDLATFDKWLREEDEDPAPGWPD